MLDADTDQTPDTRSLSWTQRLGTNLWWFFNTPIGVWLLTSGLIGVTMWQYQQWQHEFQQRAERTQRIEMLNLEIAARMSEFGTWARRNLIELSSQKYRFKPKITERGIIGFITEIGKAPENANVIPLFEMFPENRTRNLLSLYGELAHLAQEQLSHQDGDIDSLRQKIALYQYAEQALIDPIGLFGYREINHDVFICQFQKIFLTDDIGKFGLPSTDCLENKPEDPSQCITYKPEIKCSSLGENAK